MESQTWNILETQYGMAACDFIFINAAKKPWK